MDLCVNDGVDGRTQDAKFNHQEADEYTPVVFDGYLTTSVLLP